VGLFNNLGYVANPFQNQLGQIGGQFLLTRRALRQWRMTSSTSGRWAYGPITDLGVWQEIADPVNALTGEFYVDEVDLSLPGPMPLQVRRNCGNHNLANNQLGRLTQLHAYLTLAANNVIHTAELRWSVIALGRCRNLWAASR
jgi:hypothetical protein